MLYFGKQFVSAYIYSSLLIDSLLHHSCTCPSSGDLLHAVVGDVDVKVWIVIIGVTEILLSWIKTMTYVAFTSVLGDVAVVLGT